MKLLFNHLEHLESLGERHADRLNSWVGCRVGWTDLGGAVYTPSKLV